MRIELDGKTYVIEQTKKGVRVGVVIVNTIVPQHPYVRWLKTDGHRAATVISAANATNN